MITLYNFGRLLGLPDPSPFVMKAELLLKMANLPYQLNNKGFNKAPKGKLPYINDDGVLVSDSTFIRFHIEEKYQINFDKNLSGERSAVLWAAERMCEEHLYHGAIYDRWANERNFQAGPATFFQPVPAPIRPLVKYLVRRKMLSALRSQGMLRHSASQIHRLCCADVGVLSSLLGDALYFGGEEPCGADATFGAFIIGVMCPVFETPVRDKAESYANLVAYRHRMLARFYLEMAA